MTFGERIRAVDRLQKSRLFKLIATAVVVLACISGLVTYSVLHKLDAPRVELAPSEAGKPGVPEATPSQAAADSKQGPVVDNKVPSAEESNAQVAVRAINSILARQADTTQVIVPVLGATLFAVLVIWLGLGLSYLGIAVALVGLYFVGKALPGTRSWVIFLVGAGALWAIFIGLIATGRLLLSAPHQVFSIARNTLDQAVRMKVSAVFVVLLVILLAALPLLLDPKDTLRYRVQNFLQYGTGLSYTIIAVLTVLFSVYTVATEQRDRVIWQTVTKPVAAWQYVLGKWLGVVMLSAVLLSVTGGAVYLFTEYLRSQPAQGERKAFVTEDGSVMSADRRILETQVLTARVTVLPEPPALDEKAINESVEARIKAEQHNRPDFGKDPADREGATADLIRAINIEYRTIEPGRDRIFAFSGLKTAKDNDLPVILRFRPESGSNRPDLQYILTFLFPANGSSVVEKVALAQSHTIALSPGVINDEGVMIVSIVNGDFFNRVPNPGITYFSVDALEVSYAAGSYRMNFVRVFAVLWLKTAFVAMAGVCAATFLSFSVATLTAFGVFLVAESARFITGALENWNITDNKGHDLLFFWIIDRIATGVSAPFRFYSDLRPSQRLVEGILMPWSSVATGGLLLILLIVVLFAVGSLIFRSRELAIYSGN
ncbi:MAG: hypothetical protein KF805_13600 [Phycisphaeraceae bacterium]|nr:hypothetical protein [Phycisphaeraceae bacterium]